MKDVAFCELVFDLASAIFVLSVLFHLDKRRDITHARDKSPLQSIAMNALKYHPVKK